MADEIAVVGAGVAGLACAQALKAAGQGVRVFEKSRGLGGRAARRLARMADGTELAFDHGAPGFEVASAPFAETVGGWVRQGWARPWPEGGSPRLHVGVPGMSAIAKPMAAGLQAGSEIALGLRVLRVAGGPGAWHLGVEDGHSAGPFRALVLAIPAPQAVTLLGPEAQVFPELAAVEMAPRWTVMLAFPEPLAPAPPRLESTGTPLALAIRNSAKPDRAPKPETWVLHSSQTWAAAHLEAEPETVGDALVAAFAAALGHELPAPSVRLVHRWRFAEVVRPAGRPWLLASDRGIGLAGDWCAGPAAHGVDAAWMSGRGLARRLLGEV
ncbi:MAG: NAD(P)/FAD-dependent oxidoreductase [Pikeienuella sp.]